MPYIKPIWLFNLSLCLLARARAVCADAADVPAWNRAKKNFWSRNKKALPSRNYESARKTFERCLKMDPDNEDTLLSLGAVALTQEKLDAARDLFPARAGAYGPHVAVFFLQLFHAGRSFLLKRQQYAQALAIMSVLCSTTKPM